MSMIFGEYVKMTAENIARSAGFLPGVQDAIDMAWEILEDCEVPTPYANWFWQTVALEVFMRRPDETREGADDLLLAAMEALKELASDGPPL